MAGARAAAGLHNIRDTLHDGGRHVESSLLTRSARVCALAGALISATDPVATLSIFSTLDVPPLLYNLVTCLGS
jgi:hypothetical protein